MASVKGKLGERNCVLSHPQGYVYIYFGARWKYVEDLNDATRFSEAAAKLWIENHTAEPYNKKTGTKITAGNDKLPHQDVGWRASTEYTIQNIQTKVAT